jgi:regulator of protease activity HflC (stomatin/prohibitin superfamily)
MATALTWLNDLAQWLGRWIPRLVLIEPTHRGVCFGPRGGARQVGPGLVLYWPITHVLVQLPITTQSIQLSAQVLARPDDGTAMIPRVSLCAAAVQFRVHDAVAAATRVLHLHALIDNRASATIARNVSLAADPIAWARAVREELGTELVAYGVELERLDFTHNGIGVALKNVSDWNYSERVDGTRPS